MTDPLPRLDLDLCRQRQQRLRLAAETLGASSVLLSRPENVQYLTGFRPHPLLNAAVLLDANDCFLVAPNAIPEHHAATEVLTFEAQWLCTLRQDQGLAIAEILRQHGRAPSAHLGVEGTLAHAMQLSPSCIDVEPALLRLRRNKDADELAMIRHAIGATEAMYATARQILRPGIDELEVFNALQAAAVIALGEPLTATGNDYQCASPGGAPRQRQAQAGELYILDLGPAYRGYFADNCRTFSVDGQPTPAQLAAHAAVMSVFPLIEQQVRPGVSCQQVFADAKTRLDDHLPGSFFHHLGHGIGLFPHETPHLSPAWDDVFEEGDVFAVEPGLYAEELRAGIRIEENYRVTATGVEKLTSHPTDL
ncbi:MAG: aminopeptidase P family protein [Verrucomicrobiales bacterium]|nr:aminopeptidase P family protein [Verrucomicrobiales bacterium]